MSSPGAWSSARRREIHTHVARYTEDSPSRRFSGQDRVAMSLWYDRWRADGVFCVVYSDRNAHREADGVVGGRGSRPRQVNGLRASQDLGLALTILPSSPQVRPARAKKNDSISTERMRWKPCCPGDIHWVASP